MDRSTSKELQLEEREVQEEHDEHGMMATDEKAQLLNQQPQEKKSPRVRCRRLQDWAGCKRGECGLLIALVLSGFLANVCFVLGRNAGPALFATRVGAEHLPKAMFASGITIIFATHHFSKFSRRKLATKAYQSLLLRTALVLGTLYVGLKMQRGQIFYFIFYVCEDLTTLLVIMQNGAVAQEIFTATEARRLLGLIQVGASVGAVFAGLIAGPVAKVCGPDGLVLAQVATLIIAVIPNARTMHLAKSRQKESDDTVVVHQRQNNNNWKRDWLILCLAGYTFAVIVVKTTVEYEYNVVFSTKFSATAMVKYTGRLYAAAGVAATMLNLGGFRYLLARGGLRGAAYAFPVGLLVASTLILVDGASARSAFIARWIDLTARWSINNSFKAIIWIAVSVSKARAARPHVEATTKKVAAAVAALALGFAVNCGASVRQLTWICVGGCILLLSLGTALRSLYILKMTARVERRHVPINDRRPNLSTFLDEEETTTDKKTGLLSFLAPPAESSPMLRGDATFDDDDLFVASLGANAVDDAKSAQDGRRQISKKLFDRFETGATPVRLYLLREIGSTVLLTDADVKRLFEHFNDWEPTTQVAALRDVIARRRTPSKKVMDEDEPSSSGLHRVLSGASLSGVEDDEGDWEDELIAAILKAPETLTAGGAVADGTVVAAAALAAADRSMFHCQSLLERLLGATQPIPRAAAAVALLQLGGVGPFATAAAAVLESMLASATEKLRPKLVLVDTGTSLLRRARSFRTDDSGISLLDPTVPFATTPPAVYRSLSSDSGDAQTALLEAEAAAETEWHRAIEVADEGRALEAAIRLTSLRVDMQKSDTRGRANTSTTDPDDDDLVNYWGASPSSQSVEFLPGTTFLDNEEALAALRALRNVETRVTIDGLTWLDLASHRNPHISIAALELPVPPTRSTRARKRYVSRAVAASSKRETATAATTALRRVLPQDDSKARHYAHRLLLDRLERAARHTGTSFENDDEGRIEEGEEQDEDDVVCILEALLQLARDRPEDAEALGEAVHGISTLPGIDYEAGEFLLDFVNDLLDLGSVPNVSVADVEAVVLAGAEDVSRAQHAARFFKEDQVRAFASLCGSSESLADAMHLLMGTTIVEEEESSAKSTESCVARELSGVAAGYVAEKLYGARQQLLSRCVLLGRLDDFFGNRPAVLRARDAWKSLKSRDNRDASAVMELLDAILPSQLKFKVLPVLDPAGDDRGFVGGTSRPAILAAGRDARLWLDLSGDRLGKNLAQVLDVLDTTRSDERQPLVETRELAAVALLRRTRLFGGALLSQHLQPLAELCTWRTVKGDEAMCRLDETYVVAAGHCIVTRGEDDKRYLVRGAVLQEWHALGRVAKWNLPLARAVVAGGCELLVVDSRSLATVMRRVSPKFSFTLLRNLVLAVPKPRQPGGQAIDREKAQTIDPSSSSRCCSVISPLEKYLLLRDTKILRFVPDEYIATLVDVAVVIVLAPNEIVARAGQPTDATLYVLADGFVSLKWGSTTAVTLNQPGASFGNTGLLANASWPYDAIAGPHGAALLALRRTKLHDALRGRRHLAAAVAEGFLRTFGRRALQHVAMEEGDLHLLPAKTGLPPHVTTAFRVDYASISGSPRHHGKISQSVDFDSERASRLLSSSPANIPLSL